MSAAVTTQINMSREGSDPAGFPGGAAPIQTRRSSEKLSGQGSSAGGGVLIGSKPTLITVEPMRFLIMDAPRQSNLHLYIKECRRHSVTDIVRVCEPTYLAGDLRSAGIELHEMPYPDGHSPPREVLDRWLELVDRRFHQGGGGKGGASTGPGNGEGGSDNTAASSAHAAVGSPAVGSAAGTAPTIAVHCVAGLGRAPVLVAIALVEFAGMDPVEAVTLIRRHRRGAINEKQLNYLEQYRRSYKRAGAEGCSCVVQ